jgi:hypothetical protein
VGCVTAGISTDVALTVTENSVGIRRMQAQMEELEKKMTDMQNMIKTAVLGACVWMCSDVCLCVCGDEDCFLGV